MRYRDRVPPPRVLALWAGFTAAVAASAVVAVFPSYIPIPNAVIAVPIALVAAVAAGLVVRGRDARHPVILAIAVPMFAIVAIDVFKVCPGVACPTPPNYEPWRHLKLFFEWSTLGPTLGLSSEPYQCAVACPHRIELLPLVGGYVTIWAGIDGF